MTHQLLFWIFVYSSLFFVSYLCSQAWTGHTLKAVCKPSSKTTCTEASIGRSLTQALDLAIDIIVYINVSALDAAIWEHAADDGSLCYTSFVCVSASALKHMIFFQLFKGLITIKVFISQS
jgi:hypothetical protein